MDYHLFEQGYDHIYKGLNRIERALEDEPDFKQVEHNFYCEVVGAIARLKIKLGLLPDREPANPSSLPASPNV